MSRNNEFFSVYRAIVDVADITKGRMDVMLSVLRHRNDAGLSYPGIALLCKETGYTKKKVGEFLASLVKDGYLIIVDKHGDGRNTKYEISLTRLLEQLERENSIVPDMPTTGSEAKQVVPTSEYGYQEQDDYYTPPASGDTVNHFTVIAPPAPTPEQQTMHHIQVMEGLIRAGQTRQARLYAKTVLVISNEDLDAFIKDFKEQMEMEEV